MSHTATKEKPSLKVIFFAVSVRKNQSKFQNTAILLGGSQIWIALLQTDTEKNIAFKLGCSLL